MARMQAALLLHYCSTRKGMAWRSLWPLPGDAGRCKGAAKAPGGGGEGRHEGWAHLWGRRRVRDGGLARPVGASSHGPCPRYVALRPQARAPARGRWQNVLVGADGAPSGLCGIRNRDHARLLCATGHKAVPSVQHSAAHPPTPPGDGIGPMPPLLAGIRPHLLKRLDLLFERQHVHICHESGGGGCPGAPAGASGKQHAGGPLGRRRECPAASSRNAQGEGSQWPGGADVMRAGVRAHARVRPRACMHMHIVSSRQRLTWQQQLPLQGTRVGWQQ